MKNALVFAVAAAVLQLTTAGLYGFGKTDTNDLTQFLSSRQDAPVYKPKNVDIGATNIFLRAVLEEAQSLPSPCNLIDAVRDDMKNAPKKTKVKLSTIGTPMLDVTNRMVLEMAMPAIRDGIRLYRTMFVLQQTANLTVFLDQNRDHMYSNTSLRGYSHYYVRAANEDITQILFIGLTKDEDIKARGMEAPAMDFLSVNGLIRHPRQYVSFDTIPPQEAQLVMDKRQQMADLLASQGTFWEYDTEYLTSVLTVSFNGPEDEREFSEVMPKVSKNFRHMAQAATMKFGEPYEMVCAAEKQAKPVTAPQSDQIPIDVFAL